MDYFLEKAKSGQGKGIPLVHVLAVGVKGGLHGIGARRPRPGWGTGPLVSVTRRTE